MDEFCKKKNNDIYIDVVERSELTGAMLDYGCYDILLKTTGYRY